MDVFKALPLITRSLPFKFPISLSLSLSLVVWYTHSQPGSIYDDEVAGDRWSCNDKRILFPFDAFFLIIIDGISHKIKTDNF
jgi:hypothetical protein